MTNVPLEERDYEATILEVTDQIDSADEDGNYNAIPQKEDDQVPLPKYNLQSQAHNIMACVIEIEEQHMPQQHCTGTQGGSSTMVSIPPPTPSNILLAMLCRGHSG